MEQDTEKTLHLMIQARNFHHMFITSRALKNDPGYFQFGHFQEGRQITKWPTFRWGVYVVN